MKHLSVFRILCAVAPIAAFLFVSSAQAAPPRLLPFQGRLTDANGASIPDGAKVVQFKIYDAPTGGTAVWSGEVQKLTVNGGLVSTLLGSKAPFTAAADFNNPLYLEITVDANADDQITAADPPLLPRQSVLPAVFAVEAQTARDSAKLAGADWNAVFDNGNPATGKIRPTIIGDGSLPASAIGANKGITTAHLATQSVGTAELGDGVVTPDKLQPAVQQSLNPPGTIIAFAGAVTDTGGLFEPVPGYLLCNGAVINGVATNGKYAALRMVLGNAWGNGGDVENAQVVNVPDLRGVFLRGWNGLATDEYADPDMERRGFRKAGGNTENNVGSFQEDELKNHNHNIANSSASGFAGGTLARSNVSVSGNYNTNRIQSTGGSETRGKNANVVYLIKY